MTHPLIIIGAGLAGWTAAREFRKLDPATPVMLITADAGDFYAKPSLSNAFAQQRSPAQLVSTAAAAMAAAQNVSLLAHTRVTAVQPANQTVSTSQGEFSYSRLVLATGAQPIRVPVAGDAASEVLSINSLDDFSTFHDRLTSVSSYEIKSKTAIAASSKHILIMGAGLIGCEFANDLATAGYRVSVVDPSTGLMSALLPPDASAQLQSALAAQGVTWYLGVTVKAVSHRPGTDSMPPVLQVELSNGDLVLVDMVLSAVGLRADMALARSAGLVCERGVVVDATLQTSAAHIYALGDGAQYAAAGARTLPYVMPIMAAAKALALTLTGTPTPVVFPVMPVAIKTPAFPVVVVAPVPGTPGEWRSPQSGLWQFVDSQGQHRGFVLTGAHTSQRAAQAKLLTTAPTT